MSTRRVLVDSSVLYYAHDRDAGSRHQEAQRRVRGLWSGAATPIVPLTVLSEFFESLVAGGLEAGRARTIVERYLVWERVNETEDLFRRALGIAEGAGLPVRHARLIAFAQAANADVIWTTRTYPAEQYGEVFVVDPFR